MDARRWDRIRSIFTAAMELPSGERTALLEDACAGQESLRSEIDHLLGALPRCGGFLEDPVLTPSDTAKPDPLLGTRIGKYRLTKRIGRGGMGVVYLGIRNDEFSKRVAIKLLKSGDKSGEIVRRFHDERQILAALDHPNIAKLLDGGTTPEGLPYLVMDYIEGRPLDEYCDRQGLSIRKRLELFRIVCSAVHFAHQNLVVHRDLKPANILVTRQGVPKLLDFGIAKLLNPELSPGRLDPTATALRIMTPRYASPEQIRGEPITTASDVYSLGVLLYRLLSGRSPYPINPASPAEMVRAICEQEPERPSDVVLRPSVTEDAESETILLTPEEVSSTREGDPSKLRRRLAGDVDNIALMALRKEPHRTNA